MLPHVLTPSQVIIYLYDSYQLSQEVGRPPIFWNTDMCRSVSISEKNFFGIINVSRHQSYSFGANVMCNINNKVKYSLRNGFHQHHLDTRKTSSCLV